ncbi:MAG: phosphoenolpyruvate carboxykinase (ATP) [Firmicutes bacterium ZCTH02-B6]|nr:MAG: phosphoenolpyruvate carboxykinase (ATP) [Firmicutes bacterium ZCTH02-B6]
MTVDEILRGAGAVHYNLSTAALVEHAIRRGEGKLAANGAFVAETGKYTGRSPKDKFVVREPWSEQNVAWGPVNQPIEQEKFDALVARVVEYLRGKELFVFEGAAGANPKHQIRVRVVTELAWHNAFARNLLLRQPAAEGPFASWSLVYAPGFQAVPERDGTRSEAFIGLDFSKRLVLIVGTCYAGELKKSVFTVMNGVLPERGVLPMHCGANVGPDGDVALFFGLSGTGKTTLSSDEGRNLLGDDEHGWSDEGVFNFEGGCYAKTIGLSRKAEPQIWDALRFGSILENVIIDPVTRVPNYDDGSLTENTRGAYPLDHIPGAVEGGVAGHPRTIFFLSADAFGVLPPIARLDAEQAMYYFLSGYTSKLAGTERGVTSPEATFSTAFGEPFLPLPPQRYATMLGELIARHNVRVFLVNTGWVGGPYGVGRRIELRYTRAMVRAALAGELDNVTMQREPHFGLMIPTSCPGVPSEMLDPKALWSDRDAYDVQARQLAQRFAENYRRFGGSPLYPAEVATRSDA